MGTARKVHRRDRFCSGREGTGVLRKTSPTGRLAEKQHINDHGSQVLAAEKDSLARKLSRLHRALRAGVQSEVSGRHGTRIKGVCECAHVCVHVQTPISQLCAERGTSKGRKSHIKEPDTGQV